MTITETKPQTEVSSASEPWTTQDVDLIRQTVAKEASPEEFKLFLYTAKARGLDPLLRQLYFIKRKQKRGDRWVDVGTTQTSIDGFRLIANRTQKLKGIERGIKHDHENGKLYAWARVWRKDWDYPVYEEVSLEEYKGESPLWHRMPEQMLKKCAEVAALRMAFPEDLSGLYAHEEMDQADSQQSALQDKTMPLTPDTSNPSVQDVQKAMKKCLKMISKIQEEHSLTTEEIQWITGLETLKGADLKTLEKAIQDLNNHLESQKLLQSVNG